MSKTPKPDPDEPESEDSEAPVATKLTKKGQKPRTLTPEHLEKLKIARAKAREVQIKNTELRKLERENKAHEKADDKVKREKAIKEKNKEIKDALGVVKVEKNKKVSIKEPEPESIPLPEPEEESEEDITPEPVKVVKKKKPKKKPVVIVEASSDSESDDNQVIYIKRKKKKDKVERNETLVEQPLPLQPELPKRMYPINPFFNHQNYKKY